MTVIHEAHSNNGSANEIWLWSMVTVSNVNVNHVALGCGNLSIQYECTFGWNVNFVLNWREKNAKFSSWKSKGSTFWGTLKFIRIDWLIVYLYLPVSVGILHANVLCLAEYVKMITFPSYFREMKTDFLFTFDAVCSFAWINCQYVTITEPQKKCDIDRICLFVRLSHNSKLRFWSGQCVEKSSYHSCASLTIHFSLSVRRCGFTI